VNEAVDPTPTLARLFDRGCDVRGLADVHLQDVGDRVQLLGRHLRDRHHPAEAREEELGAFLLRLHRDRVTDAAAVAHPGDHDLLALEDHREIVKPYPGSLPVATGASRDDQSLQGTGESCLPRGTPTSFLRRQELF